MEALISMGVPENIAKYMKRLNQSIVKLRTDGDLVDESSDRLVLLNPDGSVNPNLPYELKHHLESMDIGNRDLNSATSQDFISELISQGFELVKSRGIAQGGATSCGISTLNLKQLFERFPTLSMYADDGVLFAEDANKIPDLSVPSAGVHQSMEKSK